MISSRLSANRKLAQLLAATFSTGGEIRHLNIVNLGPAELEVFIGSRQKAAAVRDNDAKYHKRRENVYNKAWQWTGRLARLTFVGGLALLLAFAIKNM